MHLSFMLRGHKWWQDRFINELATRYFLFDKYNYEKKKMEKVVIDARLCPITLWDFVFPAEHWDVVANTVLGGSKKGVPEMSSHKKYLWALRKAMGFRKVPSWDENAGRLMMMPAQHQEVIAVGVKDDYWITEDKKHVSKKNKTDLSWEGY